MLVLSHRRGQQMTIGDDIVITIVKVWDDKVRLGVEAPRDITVHRREVFDAIRRHNQAEGETNDPA